MRPNPGRTYRAGARGHGTALQGAGPRTTSETHQFLKFIADDLERVDCPKGWMSTEGYVRYLDTTLAKMRKREAAKGRRKGQQD